MVNLRIIFMVILIAVNSLAAQEAFNIKSSITKTNLNEGDLSTLTLTVEGNESDKQYEIEQPDLSKAFVIRSSSQSSSFSLINGNVSRKREYKYVIQAINAGIYIIDPFNINYRNKTYSTKPIRVEVKEGTAPNSPNKTNLTTRNQNRRTPKTIKETKKQKNIFLETNISTNNIFIGEAIDYSVKLYRRISLWSSIEIEQEDITDVWQEELPTSKEIVVNKNGQRYYQLELIKKKIRPLNDGPIIIPPLVTRFIIDPFSGRHELVSKTVSLNVKSLPTPIPESFTGAIGTYSMEAKISTKDMDLESVQLEILLTGTGNIAAINPPVIKDTESYRILTAPKESSNINNNSQTFNYMVIPKITGEITIEPIEFSFFSINDYKYVTLLSNLPTFNATLEDMNPNKEIFQVQEDIRFLVKPSNRDVIQDLILHPYLRVILLILNGGLISLIFIKIIPKSNKNKADSVPVIKRKLNRRVQQLSSETKIQKMDQLLIQVLKFCTGYELNTINPKEVETHLLKANYSAALIKSTMQWIKNSQAIQYSNEKFNAGAHSNSDSLKRILTNILTERKKT